MKNKSHLQEVPFCRDIKKLPGLFNRGVRMNYIVLLSFIRFRSLMFVWVGTGFAGFLGLLSDKWGLTPSRERARICSLSFV